MNTAVTARRLVLLTVVGVLVAGAVGGYSVLAAGSKPTFELAGSPSSQSVTQPFTSVAYTVQITRKNGFVGAVALSVTGLPAGTAASFSPNPTTSTGITSTMTVTRTGSVAAGTYVLAINGVSGKESASANVNLVVQSSTPAASFTINVSPSTQTLLQDDQVSYTVTITRLNTYTGNVVLTLAGLGKKTTGSFAPATISGPGGTTSMLTVAADKNAEEGLFSPVVTGTGSTGGVVRTVSFGLDVQKTRDFPIAGSATGLYPGLTKPLDLVLTNPYNFPLRIVLLSVAVEQATSGAGACGGSANFEGSSKDYTSTAFYSGPAIVVPANQARTLSALGLASSKWPTVKMNETGGNQDGCKATTVYLQYSGQGVKP